MKKIISLTLAALFCVALLAGCGKPAEPESPEAPVDPEAPEGPALTILPTEYITEEYAIALAKDNTALMDEINTALAALKEEGVVDAIVAKYIEGEPHDLTFQQDVAEDAPLLVMATNAQFPPYEYHENEQIVGIDAELAAAIADKLGRKLRIDDMEFASIIAAVNSGRADIGMAGMTVTEDRLASVNFTDSYATGVQVVIVKTGSSITTVEDLFAEGANHKIGVQENTTGDIYATSDIEDKGLGTIMRYSAGAAAVQALLLDQVDCVIIDNEPAKAFVEAN